MHAIAKVGLNSLAQAGNAYGQATLAFPAAGAGGYAAQGKYSAGAGAGAGAGGYAGQGGMYGGQQRARGAGLSRLRLPLISGSTHHASNATFMPPAHRAWARLGW